MNVPHPNYYEGILQLRNPNQEVIDFVKKAIHKAGVFVSQEKRTVNGTDLYVGSQRFLRTLGRELQARFHGEMVISTRIHTRNRQTSKEVYRVSLLFRLYDLKIGQTAKFKNKFVKITHLGKKVKGIDVDTNKKVEFNYSDLKN